MPVSPHGRTPDEIVESRSQRAPRAADPDGRRRVQMLRIGKGAGIDLSPAIDALLLKREQNVNQTPYG